MHKVSFYATLKLESWRPAPGSRSRKENLRMRSLCQKYTDNLDVAQTLVKPRLAPGITQEDGLSQIRRNAEQLFLIHQENDHILKEILFSKTADTLTADEAAELSRLAQSLFNYNRSPDTGIAYRIHRLLYDYAQHAGDTDLIIKELYLQGITLLYLNMRDPDEGINLFVDKIGEYFRAGAAYLSQYEELSNPQTRSYILRCLGNIKYGLKNFQGGNDGVPHSICDGWADYMACFERAMDVFQSPEYRRMNPEIPWDTFVYTMHYDRTQFLSGLRNTHNPEIAHGVAESAAYVYQHQEQIAKANETSVGTRTQYVYAASRFHAGLIPAEELVEKLFSICESADLHNFSGDTIWTILYTPEYLKHYFKQLPTESQDALKPQLDKAIAKQKEYLFLLPHNEYHLQISRTLGSIAHSLSMKDSQQILDYILACHPPTFVHSRMIALLTRRLCLQMARTKPELLEGTLGLSGIGQDQGACSQLLDTAYHSGLYHDLGKCMMISYVGLYSRRLLDEEFSCIKLHPIFSRKLLNSLHMEDMADIAYYHHRSYDGGGGYPCCEAHCPARIRRIVDVVTIADCLDAGTDNIGRSYAASKSYEQLVEELRAGKGTRYSPEVIELFDDPDFYSETGRFLHHMRREVYLDVYTADDALSDNVV